MLVFRYRELKEHNIKALISNSVNGSIYHKFENCGELNFGISSDTCTKYNLIEEQKQNLVLAVKNNCNNNYYLASFTKNFPSSSREEWMKYAGKKTGYCLVYHIEDIELAIRKQVLENKVIAFRDVKYSNKPYDLSPFFAKPLEELSKHDDCENKEELIQQIYDGMYSREMGKYAVDGLYHKGKQYKKFNEFRIVYQNLRKDKSEFVDAIINVKPIRIILGEKMKFLDRVKITSIANNNGIECVDAKDL